MDAQAQSMAARAQSMDGGEQRIAVATPAHALPRSNGKPTQLNTSTAGASPNPVETACLRMRTSASS
jgi:hypothetical protein